MRSRYRVIYGGLGFYSLVCLVMNNRFNMLEDRV